MFSWHKILWSQELILRVFVLSPVSGPIRQGDTGNVAKIATWLGESKNKPLAEIVRASHSLNLEATVLEKWPRSSAANPCVQVDLR